LWCRRLVGGGNGEWRLGCGGLKSGDISYGSDGRRDACTTNGDGLKSGDISYANDGWRDACTTNGDGLKSGEFYGKTAAEAPACSIQLIQSAKSRLTD
jgi:hypothetical protein